MSDASTAKPPVKPLPKPKRQRLRVFRVEGLFGKYDHTIPLRWDERVTVLHGPNGVGKTAVLRLIDAVGRGKVAEIVDEIPFRRIEVELEDGTRIEWREATEEEKKDFPSRATGKVWIVHFVGQEPVVYSGVASGVALAILQRAFTDLDTALADHKLALGLRGMLAATSTSDEEIRRFLPAQQLINDPGLQPLFVRVNRLDVPSIGWDWLKRSMSYEEHQKNPGERWPQSPTTTLQGYIYRLADLKKQTTIDYGALDQQLDRTLPSRLMRESFRVLGPDALRTRLAELDDRRAALTSFGLLAPAKEGERPPIDAVNEKNALFLSLYVADSDAKLSLLERFAEKLQILSDKLNARLLNKRLDLTHAEGLTVLDHDGSTLPLNKLSSGEQHQLVLLVDLLFHTAPGSLLLIDEPELSMHVVWQQQVLPDLLEIAKLSDFDVIVATHSPDIIGPYNRLEVGLSGEVVK
ncbi:AAA family ATPase [Myxococcota bacterium]|nr:AAA family ATPase [Myxococcota bacterium]